MLHLPLVELLLRCRYVVVSLMGVVLYIGSITSLGVHNDWEFFAWGSDALFGGDPTLVRGNQRFDVDAPAGLHLYANYPFIQIGPPALLAAAAVRSTPGDGIYVAQALVQSLGIATVFCLERTVVKRDARVHFAVLVGGSLLMVVWGSLTHFTHLDDALTLFALSAALWLSGRGGSFTAGAALGLAAATKPWGVVGLPLLLLVKPGRQRLVAGVTAVATALLFWAPFLIADAGTAAVGDVAARVFPSSVPGLLGISEIPSLETLRLSQFVGGLLLVSGLVLAGRWPWALLAAFSWRLLLEPAAYAYYPVAVVAAALLVDLQRGRPVPLLTAATSGTWLVLDTIGSADARGVIRLVEYGGLLLLCLTVGALALLRRAPARVPGE